MSSLLTNTSAMVALSTLQDINNNMATTQNRISTGLRVADASDNAAYWSIATTMKSDNGALSAVKDALGLGAATVDVAFTAMDKAVDNVNEMKKKLTTATDGSVDKEKIQSDLKEIQGQLKTVAASANFSGENWLQQDMKKDNLNKSITGSFTRTADGATSIKNIRVDTEKVVLVDTQETKADNKGILTKDMTGELDLDAIKSFITNGVKEVKEVKSATGAITTPGVAGVAPKMNIDWKSLDEKKVGFKVLAYAKAIEAKIATTKPEDYAKFDDAGLTAIKDGVDKSLAKLKGNSVLDIDISKLGKSLEDKAVLKAVISSVDTQISKMTTAATNLGSAKKRINMQKEFVGKLSDAIQRGVGQLVDADMNAESTRLKALQTQQQLGIQALSIANSGAQNILSLFR
ncbi:flagellin [Polycladidibacter stylochi]|uniref:flagellin N-terminal helical domain-containing protein n=1 Tax=Polycladidibacter stylochi TaxID=1807766 RepID=UPI00082AD936|nr:flagellin [Pseudovibrio stylochi]